MVDLSTKYMGLNLKNPIIVGSSGLTNSAQHIRKLEESGAAAVVLKSLFEEQILLEVNAMKSEQAMHTEEFDYIKGYTRQHSLDEYISLVSAARKAVSIPIIPSINCATAGEWTAFAKRLEDAGADALELNMFIMPGDIRQKSEDIERIYFDIIADVKNKVSIPLAVKISSHFTGMANMIYSLSKTGIGAVVLFNRFHRPDIDLDKMAVGAADIFSSPEENLLPLRWAGMLSGRIECDLATTTGIHDGDTVLKNILAGASAVQIATIIYKKGPDIIGGILSRMEERLNARKIKALGDIKGRLSQANIKDPVVYERSQFMRYFSDARI